jgi:hypothetical protein
MDSRSYIKLTGNLTNITGTTGGTCVNLPIAEPFKTKIINIGYWNMDASSQDTRVVSTGVPLAKIRNVDVMIRGDNCELVKIEKNSGNWEIGGYLKVCCCPTNNVQVEIGRNDYAGAAFRTSNYNCDYWNRGWVTVLYSNIVSPSGITGIASNIQATCMSIDDNKVTFKGNDYTVCEYGVVYSQSTSNPTISNSKVCTLSDIAYNVPYSKIITGLNDSTMTYFRMYAKNSEEVGYGQVCCQMTLSAVTLTDVYIGLMECYDNTTPQHKDGLITIKNSVGDIVELGTGQCVEVSLDYHQLAQNSGDVACIQILKSCNGGGYYYEYPFTPPPYTTYYSEGGINQYEGSGTGSIMLRKGDCICWVNDISGTGYGGQLRSDFWISNLVGTSITAHCDGSYTYVHLP